MGEVGGQTSSRCERVPSPTLLERERGKVTVSGTSHVVGLEHRRRVASLGLPVAPHAAGRGVEQVDAPQGNGLAKPDTDDRDHSPGTDPPEVVPSGPRAPNDLRDDDGLRALCHLPCSIPSLLMRTGRNPLKSRLVARHAGHCRRPVPSTGPGCGPRGAGQRGGSWPS